MPEVEIVWTGYMRYRARIRQFDLARIENILRQSTEHYFDSSAGHHVAVGRHDKLLVLIPYHQGVRENDAAYDSCHDSTTGQFQRKARTAPK